MSDFELVDQVIIVTGAAGGIGSEMCREFASAGATVVLAGRTEESLKAVAAELGGATSLVVPTDITRPDEVENLIAATVDAFERVDVIVNNAGAGVTPCEAEDTPYDVWVRMIDVNLTATFNCCMAAGKQMIEQKAGKIINISSTAGTKGHPGMLHYSAAKAGVLSLTNNLAYNWARHNICVNAVVPATADETPRAGGRCPNVPLPGIKCRRHDHRRSYPGTGVQPDGSFLELSRKDKPDVHNADKNN
jgi:gluconate 5-dehydrogenase